MGGALAIGWARAGKHEVTVTARTEQTLSRFADSCKWFRQHEWNGMYLRDDDGNVILRLLYFSQTFGQYGKIFLILPY